MKTLYPIACRTVLFLMCNLALMLSAQDVEFLSSEVVSPEETEVEILETNQENITAIEKATEQANAEETAEKTEAAEPAKPAEASEKPAEPGKTEKRHRLNLLKPNRTKRKKPRTSRLKPKMRLKMRTRMRKTKRGNRWRTSRRTGIFAKSAIRTARLSRTIRTGANPTSCCTSSTS